MKETLKSKKGITLIALVITIIILIILAGISISMLMGENGLITKAKEGRQNMQNATIEEQERLNALYADLGTGTIVNSDVSLIEQTNITENAATADKILKDYKAYVNGELLTGTMNNYSSNPEKITLTAGQKGETTIDISDGYHTEIKVDASAVYDAGYNAGVTENQYEYTGTAICPLNNNNTWSCSKEITETGTYICSFIIGRYAGYVPTYGTPSTTISNATYTATQLDTKQLASTSGYYILVYQFDVTALSDSTATITISLPVTSPGGYGGGMSTVKV